MTRQESGGPRTPITSPNGPHGFPTGPSGFSSFSGGGERLVLFSFRGGKFRLFSSPEGSRGFGPAELRLELPAPSAAFDPGAIAASAEIVVTRNPGLADILAAANQRAQQDSGLSLVNGELYLRIRKPAAIDGRRTDIPSNPFAARALRPVPDRLFRGREE
jgi:hypothetical protein